MHWRRRWQPTPVFLPGEIPGMGEPGGLRSMGSHRVGHYWSDLAAVYSHIPKRRDRFGGMISNICLHYVNYKLVTILIQASVIHTTAMAHGKGNGTPLQYSCLENPMDGGAWWATVHGATKSQIRLSNWPHILVFLLPFITVCAILLLMEGHALDNNTCSAPFRNLMTLLQIHLAKR